MLGHIVICEVDFLHGKQEQRSKSGMFGLLERRVKDANDLQ